MLNPKMRPPTERAQRRRRAANIEGKRVLPHAGTTARRAKHSDDALTGVCQGITSMKSALHASETHVYQLRNTSFAGEAAGNGRV